MMHCRRHALLAYDDGGGAALDALQIEAVSGPAIGMLQQFFDAVPHILAAAEILTVTWFVARFAAGLIGKLLAGVGFDQPPVRLCFAHAFKGELSASALVGRLVLFFAMLFATVEAANRLGFGQVSDIVAMFIQFGGDILLGGVILVIGFWLACARTRPPRPLLHWAAPVASVGGRTVG